MATIDDFGGSDAALNAPALGGPTGWAAAVRDAVRALEATVLNNTNAISQNTSAIAALEPWQGTQAEYDALGTYDPERTYFVIG